MLETPDLLAETMDWMVPTLSIVLPAHDPRGPKAVRLATQARSAGWPHVNAYFVPSASNSRLVYVTTRVFCTCPAFTYADRRAVRDGVPTHRCYHSLAVEMLDQLASEVAAF